MPARFQGQVSYDRGDQIVIKLPYTANPHATATWTKSGVSIDDDNAFKFDLTDAFATLTIRHANATHTGIYELKLENQVGFDSCKIAVHILGKLFFLYFSTSFFLIQATFADVPEPPTNVKVEGIRNETVELSWQAPENDGGSPVTGYFIERCEQVQNTQLWTRSGMSKSTLHLVENLQSNHKYLFRVIAENAQGRSPPSEPTDHVLVKGKSPPANLQVSSQAQLLRCQMTPIQGNDHPTKWTHQADANEAFTVKSRPTTTNAVSPFLSIASRSPLIRFSF